MPVFPNDPVICDTSSTNPALKAVSENHTPQAGPGVMGISDAVGVWGESNTWHGVAGLTKSTTGGHGVYGKNTSGGTGVVGESDGWMGVYGRSGSTTGGAGVMGEGNPGPGVIGKSTKWVGVYGETAGIENGPAGVWGEHKGAGVGVKAISQGGPGLYAYSKLHEAVHAETESPGTAAIAAYNKGQNGAAIFAKKEGAQGHAGFFDGNVFVSKDLAVGGSLKVAGVPIDAGQVGSIGPLGQRVTQLESRVTALQQQVAGLQQQINDLKQTHSNDVAGIATSLVTLAERCTALEGAAHTHG
jgi:hypothetical protein